MDKLLVMIVSTLALFLKIDFVRHSGTDWFLKRQFIAVLGLK